MQNYSLTVLVKDKLDDKGRTAVIDSVKKDFGNLIKEDLWGVRSLAYEIKHADKAYFAHFEFESDPKAVITLDKNIRLNEDIIRYLLVKAKKTKLRNEGRKTVAKAVEVTKEAKGAENLEAEAKAEEKPKKKVVVKAKKKE